MSKSQLLKRIEVLEESILHNRKIEFLITKEHIKDDEKKIIVVFWHG